MAIAADVVVHVIDSNEEHVGPLVRGVHCRGEEKHSELEEQFFHGENDG
jgi:hypothetical protein